LNKRWKIEKEKIENKQAWSHGDLLLLATGEQWVDYDYVGSRNGSRVQRLLLYLHNLHSTSQSLHAGSRKKLTDSRNASRLHPEFFQAY